MFLIRFLTNTLNFITLFLTHERRLPRRKTVQPLPLRIIEDDEFFIEVRDRATALIGRGLHAENVFDETLDEILDYITPEAFIRKSDDNWYYKEPACLKNAAAFARYCELKGIDRESGALRKRYYGAVKKLVRNYSLCDGASSVTKPRHFSSTCACRNRTGTA